MSVSENVTKQVCAIDHFVGKLLLSLSCLSLSGRAGPLPIKGNKLCGSLGYRCNPQGALLQAEWLRAGEVGVIWPDSVWGQGTSTMERHPQ